MISSIAGLLLLAGALNAAPSADSPPTARPEAGAAAAIAKIDQMIATIKKNKPRPDARSRSGREKIYILSQDEINTYVGHWVATQGEKVKEVRIKSGVLSLEEGRVIEAQAVIQLGVGSLQFLGAESESILAKTLKQHLAMDNSVHLECIVSSAKGKAYVKILSAKIKGVSIPESWIQMILETVGKHQRPGRDFTKFFDLPNGIEKVEILPQALKLQLRLQ